MAASFCLLFNHATAACRCTSVWIAVAASAVHNVTLAAVVAAFSLAAIAAAAVITQLLPGGARAPYELWADLGELLLAGAPAAGL